MLEKKKKESEINYFTMFENQDTVTERHSQLLPDLKEYIILIPLECTSP